MSVLAPPPQDELELLIREARQRQRRRRVFAVAVVAAAASAAFGIYDGVVTGSSATTHRGNRTGVPVADLQRCRSSQLHLAAPAWGAAAGSLYENVILTNASGTSCSLAGWPAVRRFNAAGQAIPVRLGRWVYKVRGPAPFRAVRLAPGGAATFEIFGADWNHRADRSCPVARMIRVEPRGGGGWLSVALHPADRGNGIPACSLWLLGPLVPGRTADPPAFALSLFYSPPTQTHRYFAGQMNGVRWQLRAHGSCISIVTNGAQRSHTCLAGKLGWMWRSRGPSFVAGAVPSTATHVAIGLSNGKTIYAGTMAPNRFVAPGSSFFFTTVPRGVEPVAIRARTDSGRLVGRSER